jgi:hypothetical protein
MLAKNKHNVNFLFPKYFRMFELLESNIKVVSDDIVYNIPTYFKGMMLDKKVEFT